MAIELTPEEEAVLQDHSVEDLGELTAKADEALLRASPEERDEAYRRYLMLLNLGAKVIVYERPAPSPELLRAQEEYGQIVRQAAKSGKPLSEAEQGKLKEKMFAEQVKGEQAGFKTSETSGDKP